MRRINLLLTPFVLLGCFAFHSTASHALSLDHIKLVGKGGIEARVLPKSQGRIRFHVEHSLWSKGPKASFNVVVRRYYHSVWGAYDRVTSPLAPHVTTHAHKCSGGRAAYDCSIYQYFVGDVHRGDYVSGTAKFCYNKSWPFKNYCKTYKVFSFFN